MELLLELKGHTTQVLSCALSEDGRTAASVAKDGCLILWDIREGKSIAASASHRPSMSACVAFTPDGSKVLSCCDTTDDHVLIRSGKTLRCLNVLEVENHEFDAIIGQFALSPDGTRIATAGQRRLHQGEVSFWDMTKDKPSLIGPTQLPFPESLKGHDAKFVAFSGDGSSLVSVSLTHKIKLFDVATRQMTAKLSEGHKPKKNAYRGVVFASCTAFAPNASFLSVGDTDGQIYLYDGHNCKTVTNFEADSQWVKCCTFSPDSRMLLTGGADCAMKIWNAGSWKLVFTQNQAHKVVSETNDREVYGAAVNCCKYSGNNTVISCGGESVSLWRVL